MPERNIAKLVRDSAKPNPSNVEARERAMAAVQKLYPEQPCEVETRKGIWRVYSRSDFPLPPFAEQEGAEKQPGSCAVYLQEGIPRSLFLGPTTERASVEGTAELLSRKVLEQRPLVSRPARSLNSDNGLAFGLRIGLLIVFLLGLLVALDFVLLPRFGPEVARGVSISTSTDVEIRGYTSIIRSFLDRVFGPGIYPLITSMYSLAVLVIVPILVFGIVFELSGKRADRRRVRDLPAQARDFRFGREAWEELFRQETMLADEKAKRQLFDRFRVLELRISRRDFLNLYEEMKQLLSSDSG